MTLLEVEWRSIWQWPLIQDGALLRVPPAFRRNPSEALAVTSRINTIIAHLNTHGIHLLHNGSIQCIEHNGYHLIWFHAQSIEACRAYFDTYEKRVITAFPDAPPHPIVYGVPPREASYYIGADYLPEEVP